MDHKEVLTREAEGPDVVLRYADHADGLVDIFLPASLGRPDELAELLVLIHGGFWRQEYDRTHVRPLANALIGSGWVVAVPEYRRTGGEGGWPATGDDIRHALDVIPAMVDAVAPGRIDPSRPVTLIGHSAGGHLALWAGLYAGRERVRRIVALAPVSDLRYAAMAGLDHNATQALVGGEPDDEPAAYEAADPFGGLALHSSTDSEHPSITIIHGTDDHVVPAEMSRAAATRHPRVTYVELDGVDHFALIDPVSDVFASSLLPALRQPSAR